MNEIQLIYATRELTDHGSKRLSDYGIQHEATIFLIHKLSGGGPGPAPSALRLLTDELDSRYDYDFSDVTDDGKKYIRGGFAYRRPYGWKRMAIKVVGMYENDEWLGPNGIRTEEAPGEWPVCYHGTSILRVNPILKQGFKPGPRALYGSGIYTSPSLEMVERLYAQQFTHEGKSFKIAFQNRVNPNRLQVIPASQTGVGADYWLSQNKHDVRPYGVLIREV